MRIKNFLFLVSSIMVIFLLSAPVFAKEERIVVKNEQISEYTPLWKIQPATSNSKEIKEKDNNETNKEKITEETDDSNTEENIDALIFACLIFFIFRILFITLTFMDRKEKREEDVINKIVEEIKQNKELI